MYCVLEATVSSIRHVIQYILLLLLLLMWAMGWRPSVAGWGSGMLVIAALWIQLSICVGIGPSRVSSAEVVSNLYCTFYFTFDV